MLLMVERGIRDGIWQAIHQYAKVNNKYMKYCNKNKELSYLKECHKSCLQFTLNGLKIFLNLMHHIKLK